MRFALLPLLLLVALVAVPGYAAPPAPAKHIENFTARDYRGKETSLADYAKSKAVVVAFVGVECPLAKLYGPRLAELAAEYEPKGVAFLCIDSNRQDAISEIAHYAREHVISFPVLKDVGNAIADQFGAQRTPEVFLLDADRTVRYAGRIDDQYGLGNSSGYAQAKVRNRFLGDALDEVLTGKPVSLAKTDVQGCLIGRVRDAKKDSPVTYSNQVARILQNNCVECHRAGQIAPFALTNYDEVAGWADMIEEVVREQRMPPWHADPKFGKFSNDRSLSEQDKKALYAWVKNGAPEGNPADLPKPITYPETWQIAEPEQVVYMDDKPYAVPAEGTVEYQYFMVDPGWTEDKWVKASECLIGNRSVVHHVFVFAISPENPLAKLSGYLGSKVQPSIGDGSVRLIAGAAPGTPPASGPAGAAQRVTAGTKLMFQMHYTPNGTAQEDRTCVGFTYARPEEVKHSVDVRMATNFSFVIPPRADNYPVESVYKFSKDALLLNLTPHMHLRGKSFKFDLKYPDGTVETLLSVPRYDFNWQVIYTYGTPKFVPAGTEMRCLAHFNNSESNLANPDPNSPVSWGDQTWEEMMIGWFNSTEDVYPSDREGAASRTERFVADARRNPPKIGKFLGRAAEGALKSEAAMEKFLDRLAKELPQVDRICVSVVDGGQVRFLQVAQPHVLDAPLGRAERTYPADKSSLAGYIRAAEPAMNPDLAAAAGDDAAMMSRVLGSSVHLPINVGGRPATISFWSLEKNAFPDPAVDLLRQVTKLVESGAGSGQQAASSRQ
ncbi:MAG: redoxin domain-containing protein [Planctomycetia bacterium]|nr:redoxin domain-containing protein [Planctomycetia bacterium]